MIQYCVYTGGVVLLIPSLYLMLTGSPQLEPLVAIASVIIFIGVLLFAAIIFGSSETVTRSTAVPSR
ncbi:hypothetical protein D9M72_651490 [compost metagenome]